VKLEATDACFCLGGQLAEDLVNKMVLTEFLGILGCQNPEILCLADKLLRIENDTTEFDTERVATFFG